MCWRRQKTFSTSWLCTPALNYCRSVQLFGTPSREKPRKCCFFTPRHKADLACPGAMTLLLLLFFSTPGPLIQARERMQSKAWASLHSFSKTLRAPPPPGPGAGTCQGGRFRSPPFLPIAFFLSFFLFLFLSFFLSLSLSFFLSFSFSFFLSGLAHLTRAQNIRAKLSYHYDNPEEVIFVRTPSPRHPSGWFPCLPTGRGAQSRSAARRFGFFQNRRGPLVCVASVGPEKQQALTVNAAGLSLAVPAWF